jgi:hypothetical protein
MFLVRSSEPTATGRPYAKDAIVASAPDDFGLAELASTATATAATLTTSMILGRSDERRILVSFPRSSVSGGNVQPNQFLI